MDQTGYLWQPGPQQKPDPFSDFMTGLAVGLALSVPLWVLIRVTLQGVWLLASR